MQIPVIMTTQFQFEMTKDAKVDYFKSVVFFSLDTINHFKIVLHFFLEKKTVIINLRFGNVLFTL
jgi:hypothetical protein